MGTVSGESLAVYLDPLQPPATYDLDRPGYSVDPEIGFHLLKGHDEGRLRVDHGQIEV